MESEGERTPFVPPSDDPGDNVIDFSFAAKKIFLDAFAGRTLKVALVENVTGEYAELTLSFDPPNGRPIDSRRLRQINSIIIDGHEARVFDFSEKESGVLSPNVKPPSVPGTPIVVFVIQRGVFMEGVRNPLEIIFRNRYGAFRVLGSR